MSLLGKILDELISISFVGTIILGHVVNYLNYSIANRMANRDSRIFDFLTPSYFLYLFKRLPNVEAEHEDQSLLRLMRMAKGFVIGLKASWLKLILSFVALFFF